MYTAQINSHGNVIVCKGDVERNTYRIVFRGSYQDCILYKMKRI